MAMSIVDGNAFSHANSILSGSTVSVTPSARMKTYGNVNVPQQTRHARRIYCGGIPPNFTDEDGLRHFINAVIAQGLGEENDHSYVLSVYINHKKCFAFVELKSIELATACLSLDGIIFRNIVLRILRANEYKPELVPPHLNKTIHFDLTGFQFGTPNAPCLHEASEGHEFVPDKCLEMIIESGCDLNLLTSRCVVLVGYPFEDSSRRTSNRGLGAAHAPKCLRSCLHKNKYGSIENPEFCVDLSEFRFADLGDIMAAKSPEDAKTNLRTVIAELLSHKSIPFVIGGSNDCTSAILAGVNLDGSTKCAVVIVSAVLDTTLVDDPSICLPNDGQVTFEGRFAQFAAQGAQCHTSDVRLIESRNGRIYWLQKHIRSKDTEQSVGEQFKRVINEVSSLNGNIAVPVVVVLDTGSICSSSAPFVNSSQTPVGLLVEEVADIARISGAHPQVSAFSLTEFSPENEDSRSNLLLADIFYQFCIGVATRPKGD